MAATAKNKLRSSGHPPIDHPARHRRIRLHMYVKQRAEKKIAEIDSLLQRRKKVPEYRHNLLRKLAVDEGDHNLQVK